MCSLSELVQFSLKQYLDLVEFKMQFHMSQPNCTCLQHVMCVGAICVVLKTSFVMMLLSYIDEDKAPLQPEKGYFS